jgi:hypothetical protein
MLKTKFEKLNRLATELIDRLLRPAECHHAKSRTLEELLAIKSLEEWLNPPSPEMTEADHQLALSRLAFDDTIFGWLYDMERYIKILMDLSASNEEIDKAKKYALATIEAFDDWKVERGDSEWWEPLFYGQSYLHLRESLKSPHSGDCTAAPATCSRCLAEEFYRIPYTATFTKHEGYQLWQAYVKSFKQEKEA